MNEQLVLKEIQENRKKFRVDHFDIILEEYLRKEKTGKLILDPPYQRMFRWGKKDQSALIESIILGIPLPPIFVFQKETGEWELIDGLQRTTTILNFMDNEKTFELEELEILKSLNGMSKKTLTDSVLSKIENFRIRIELVEETEDIFSQYLLFDRLNSNGEKLEAQEKRNFLIYKKNKEFYNKIQELSKNEDFINVLGWDNTSKKNSEEKQSIREQRMNKQENVEYAIKFLLARYHIETIVKKNKKKTEVYDKIETLINHELMNYLNWINSDKLEEEYKIFIKTFKILNKRLGKNSLKKNGRSSNNISNRFTVTTGLSFLIQNNKLDLNKLEEIISQYYNSKEYERMTKSGYSPTKRIYELNEYSYKFICGDINEL